MHCILCIVFYALYYMQYSICIVIYALFDMHLILCIVSNVLYFLLCILCIFKSCPIVPKLWKLLLRGWGDLWRWLCRHSRQNISAGVNGGPSGGSSVCRPRSKDPPLAPAEISFSLPIIPIICMGSYLTKILGFQSPKKLSYCSCRHALENFHSRLWVAERRV
jgi:hypothetical protein